MYHPSDSNQCLLFLGVGALVLFIVYLCSKENNKHDCHHDNKHQHKENMYHVQRGMPNHNTYVSPEFILNSCTAN